MLEVNDNNIQKINISQYLINSTLLFILVHIKFSLHISTTVYYFPKNPCTKTNNAYT